MIRYTVPFLLGFGVTFFALERWGLFAPFSSSYSAILHSIPFLLCSSLLIVLYSVTIIKKKAGRTQAVIIVSLVMIMSGLWISYFTRFSADFVITEGQTMTSGNIQYMPGSLSRGRFSSDPEFGIELKSISFEVNGYEQSVNNIQGRLLLYYPDGSRVTRNAHERLSLPRSGFRMTIKDFGYSPRFELKDKNGRVLDSAFMYMDLLPKGSEDYFRLLYPTTYYLKYFPANMRENKKASFHVRIVRNKDIVANERISEGEEVSFDDGTISFPEVRKWVRIRMTRDRGMVIILAGIMLFLICGSINIFKWHRKTEIV